MAVVWTHYLFGGRTGELNDALERTYSEFYQTKTDAATDTAAVVLDGLGIGIGDAHPDDAGARARKIRPQQDEGTRVIWRVEVEYSSVLREPDQQAQDPLEEKRKIGFRTRTRQEAFERDVDGHRICNSAGDPFDPPPVFEVGKAVLTVQKNFAAFDADHQEDFLYTVNDDDVTIGGNTFAAGTLLLIQYDGDRDFKNGVEFWPHTFQFLRDADGWHFKPLDRGYRQLNADDNDWVRITDDGIPISKPALLDGAGHKLAVGDPEQYLDFEVRGARDFDELEVGD